MKLNKFFTSFLAIFLLLLIAQFVFLEQTNPPVENEPDWDSIETKTTFYKLCADCHSNQTVYPWYSNVPPVSFLVHYDIAEGRKHFNISEKGSKDSKKAAHTVKTGEMPLWIYTLIHRGTVLEPAEKEKFIKGLEATFGVYEKEGIERNIYSNPED